MSAQDLLQLLTKVKRTGDGQWVACCPAHEDRSPSMTIKELSDGRVLIHDFAGCSVDEILGSLGLQFDVLFPEKSPEFYKQERLPFNPRDVLKALSHETLIVGLAASSLARGEQLNETDKKRLMIAIGRINNAAEMCHAI